MKWHRNNFWISDELTDVDTASVNRLLSSTYWAASRPKERTERALSQSLCFSLKQECQQVGFARVITDGACYAIVVDVVIDSRFQKKGLGRWLLSVISAHPTFTGTVLILWTTNQVGFYQACGLQHEPGFQVMRQAPDWMKAETKRRVVDNSVGPNL